MFASFESGEEIKGTEFLKSQDDIMRCFPFSLFSLEGCPCAPLVSRQNRNFMSERGDIFSWGKFPLIHQEVRWKNQNRKAANKKVTSAMMQNQERRQRRLSDLSIETGNTNKTSSSQHAENSTTSGVKQNQRSQQAMSLFTGAVIHGGQFSNSINSLNQSLKLA